MNFISSSYTINCNITPIPNALPKLSLYRNLPKVCHLSTNSQISPSPFSLQPSVIQTKYRSSFSLVPFDAKNSSGISGEDDHDHDHDHRALETVLNLYSAIRNQNICELSDIIGDECRCICNFFSFFQPFQGKKQVVDFFSYLIRSLGNNIEFVVNPTFENGMNVGVAWRLEWNKTHVPLGKGFSFYICQIYQGKALIRNVEMFMEPLFHIEPYRLKMMGYTMAILDKISPCTISKGITKKRLYISVFVLVFIILILLFSKPGFY